MLARLNRTLQQRHRLACLQGIYWPQSVYTSWQKRPRRAVDDRQWRSQALAVWYRLSGQSIAPNAESDAA